MKTLIFDFNPADPTPENALVVGHCLLHGKPLLTAGGKLPQVASNVRLPQLDSDAVDSIRDVAGTDLTPAIQLPPEHQAASLVMLEQMKSSTFAIVPLVAPEITDAKLCMEFGAAVIFDKPIIGIVVPSQRGRVAQSALDACLEIVYMTDDQDSNQVLIEDAARRVMNRTTSN